MFKLAEPTGKHGRWGQAGKALGAFLFLGILSNRLYALAHPPLWIMFTYMGLSVVFALVYGFMDVFGDPAGAEDGDTQSSPVSEP